MPLAESTIERFIEFVECFKPGYASTVQPGDPEAVEELEGLLGYALPPLYRAMLLGLGGSMGDLDAFRTRDLSLELVLWYHREPPWPRRAHFLVIGADIDDPAFDYFLDLRRPTGDDFEIVSFPRSPEWPKEETRAGKFYRMFSTLREMLFYSAFDVDRVGVMPHKRSLYVEAGKSDAESRFESMLVRLGAVPIPELCTGHARGYDSDDLAAISYRGLQSGVWFATLASNDRRRLAHVTEVFLDHGFLTTKE